MKTVQTLILFISFSFDIMSQPTYIHRNGQDIYINGINLAWINYANDLGNFDQVAFTTALSEIKAAGGNTIRWWLHTNGTNNPTFDNDKVSGISKNELANLKTALDLSNENGILVCLCLWSFGMQATDQGLTEEMLARNRLLLTDTAYTNAYIRNALVPMVRLLKGHPAILCWEVFNEPEGMSTEFGWSNTNHVAMQYIQRVTNLVAGAIHREDPNALVSNGTWTVQANSDVGGYTNYYRNDRLINQGGDTKGYLDFYMVHYYTFNGTQFSPFRHDVSYWGLDKPLVIGEFPAYGLPGETSAPAQTPAELYNWAYNHGYAGALAWTYSNKFTTPDDPNYTGCLTDCADALLGIANLDSAHVNILQPNINFTPSLVKDLPLGMAYLGMTDTITIDNLYNYFSDEDIQGLTFNVDSESSLASYLIASDGYLKVVPKNEIPGIVSVQLTARDTGNKSTVVPFIFSLIDSTNNNRLLFRNIYSSSIQDNNFRAMNAVDTSLYTTRWSSQYHDNQWLLIRLDKEYTLQRILFRWEAAYGQQYEVQVSIDSSSWQTVYTEARGDGGWDKIIFSPVITKFVRLNCIKRGTQWGFSIWDMEAFSDKDVNHAPTIAAHIADKTVIAGSRLSIPVSSVATDPDLGERFNYGFTLLDGSDLPSWLTYIDSTVTLSGTPAIFDTSTLMVLLKVTDTEGAQVTDTFSITVKSTQTSVPVATKLEGINVHPNPAKGYIIVSCDIPNNNQVELSIVDDAGREVYQEVLQNGFQDSSYSIDVSNITAGIYILKCRSGSSILNKKIMITK